MMGSGFFDRHSGLLVGPIPWAYAGTSAAIAAILMLASVFVIRRREF
jgi:hypothetical protein